jgi:hypothetical protein
LSLQVIINGTDRSRFIEKDGFPEAFEESLKGEGHTEYQVKEFDLPLRIQGWTVTENDEVIMKIRETGDQLLKGRIDSIDNALSDVVTATVYPEAILLKDTKVGLKKNLNDSSWEEGDPEDEDDDIVQEFKTDGVENVREILSQVLQDVNRQQGTSFWIDQESCPDPPAEHAQRNRFIGSELMTVEKEGILGMLIDTIMLGIGNNFDDEIYFRYNGENLFLVHHDGGFHRKKILSRGQWLNLSLKKEWEILGVEFGFNFGTFRVPSEDVFIPVPSMISRIYLCQGGGLDLQSETMYFPVWPFDEDRPSESDLGSEFEETASENLGNVSTRVQSYCDENALFDPEVQAAHDTDSRNTYIRMEARRTNRFRRSIFVMSYETAFDFNYAVHYRNTSASDILKDLATVTDRWFYVDGSSRLWFLPRGTGCGSVTIPRRQVLKLTKKTRKLGDLNININRYEEDADGRVNSYGLKLRKNEWEAVKRILKDRYEDKSVESYELEVLNPAYDLQLMREASVGNQSGYGTIVERCKGFLENIMNLRTEKYV